MPIQELIPIWQSKDMKQNVILSIAMNCAPVLKGSKAANIMTVTLYEFQIIKEMLQGTDIYYHLLKARNDKYIIFLFRKNALLQYLERPEVESFLKTYGYDTTSLTNMLAKLSMRFKNFGNGAEFPHEIGAFLEYPIEDIKGYLENQGKNFVLMGYWKVYSNEEKTAALFRKFDRERELSVLQVLQGKTIQEICCSI